jgi:hypothetical protein
MIVDEDILDLIRALPNEINDSGTTTEMKFLTVGGVLWKVKPYANRSNRDEQRRSDCPC